MSRLPLGGNQSYRIVKFAQNLDGSHKFSKIFRHKFFGLIYRGKAFGLRDDKSHGEKAIFGILKIGKTII